MTVFAPRQSAGADLSTEPKLSRVIVSFLLNRIRAQRRGGFKPPVNRAAGRPLKLAGVSELLLDESEEAAGCSDSEALLLSVSGEDQR